MKNNLDLGDLEDIDKEIARHISKNKEIDLMGDEEDSESTY
jgi:hypothetical protein